MYKESAIVKLKNGLNARPAALFVREANKYNCDIFVEIEDKTVNAKSIMGIMSLIINNNSHLEILTDGKDEVEAATKLKEFLEKEDVSY